MRGFLESKYYQNSDQTLPTYLQSRQVSDPDEKALYSWQGNFIDNLTAQNAYKIIHNLTEKLKELPVVTVYIAVMISETDIDRVGAWFRSKLHTSVMLDVFVKPSLIAGCSFVYNGKYFDYSFHNLIIKNQDQIYRILHQYAPNYQ